MPLGAWHLRLLVRHLVHGRLLLRSPIHHVLLRLLGDVLRLGAGHLPLGSQVRALVLSLGALLVVYLRRLHMVVLRRAFMVPHMVASHGRIQWRTSTSSKNSLSNCCRLELTTRVDDGSLVSVGWTCVTHMHTTRAVRSINPITIHLLLLGSVVGRVPDVHPVVRGESWIRHSLGRLSSCGWSPIMV